MLRTALGSERIQRVDPNTGIKVVQLTSYPTPAAHFLYEWPSITPDNRRVVFWAQRATSRNAPWDLYRCDTDGLNLYQLTERNDRAEVGGYYGRPTSKLTLDGKTVYVIWGQRLSSVDVETGEIEDILSFEDVCAPDQTLGHTMVMSGHRIYVNRSGDNGVLRADLDTGAVEEVDMDGRVVGAVYGLSRLIVQRGSVVWGTVQNTDGSRAVTNTGDILSMWNVDETGGDARFICNWNFAHMTTLGGSAKLQGTGAAPDKCIWIAEEGKEPYKLVQGPYFWHSGASFDGEWIVADTNWPDEGLQLIHVPTRNFTTLCHPGATQDHGDNGHPHPALSQDGRVCVFRSDRFGMSQVYVALITNDFRERIMSGNTATGPKWM